MLWNIVNSEASVEQVHVLLRQSLYLYGNVRARGETGKQQALAPRAVCARAHAVSGAELVPVELDVFDDAAHIAGYGRKRFVAPGERRARVLVEQVLGVRHQAGRRPEHRRALVSLRGLRATRSAHDDRPFVGKIVATRGFWICHFS